MNKMLYYFGYMKNPNNPDCESMTAFYEQDKHDPEFLKTHAQFRGDNEKSIKYVANAGREQMKKIQYQCLDLKKEVNLYDIEFAKVATVPLIDYTQKLLYPHKYAKSQ